jgi:hypothetical protein
MQFHDHAAYRVGNDVVVLSPGLSPQHFTLSGLVLTPAPVDAELEREALAYSQWPVMAYESGWYRGPGSTVASQSASQP